MEWAIPAWAGMVGRVPIHRAALPSITESLCSWRNNLINLDFNLRSVAANVQPRFRAHVQPATHHLNQSAIRKSANG